jgi:NAD-dependent deacetylase
MIVVITLQTQVGLITVNVRVYYIKNKNMKIAILTGAGISAESGIETFRDIKNGLWYNYNIDEVATAEAWENNKGLVLEFHNMLRNKSREILPNVAHIALKYLEDDNDVTIVTQNVDNLHEKAGSSKVLHIHGELFKGRDSDGNTVDLEGDLNIGDNDYDGVQIRPHTVLFGEYPFHWDESTKAIAEADVLLVIGTSFSIQYIPHMVASVKHNCKVYYIDPNPDPIINHLELRNLKVINKTATIGVIEVVKLLLTDK